jgi:hypothetical protein
VQDGLSIEKWRSITGGDGGKYIEVKVGQEAEPQKDSLCRVNNGLREEKRLYSSEYSIFDVSTLKRSCGVLV